MIGSSTVRCTRARSCIAIAVPASSVDIVIVAGLLGGDLVADKLNADGVAYVCTHLEEIRDGLRCGATGGNEGDEAEELEQLLVAVRGGGDVGAALRRLHERLLAEGDSLGVLGQSRGTPAQFVGVAEPYRPEPIYLCPSRRCSRFCWPKASAEEPPICEIDGAAMLLRGT